jgi:peroxiredoxin
MKGERLTSNSPFIFTVMLKLFKMTRPIFCLLAILILEFKCHAQIAPSFNLLGKINIESAKILLMPVGDSSYYPERKGVRKGSINHGKFNFNGGISYPYAFLLQVINDSNKLLYVSSIFFIDSGTQRINCNINSVRENPQILNLTTEEKRGIYDKAYIQVNKEFSDFYRKKDSLNDKYTNNNVPSEISANYSKEYQSLEHKRDLVLLKYTKKHPDSFVALWELISRLSSGYRSIYDSIYSQFSVSIKQTVTGKRLYDQLRSSEIVNLGNKFPPLLLYNIKNEKSGISINKNKKYTLIDFWFSHCFPCISQFGELKNLFSEYSKKGFDIISISVDDSTHVEDWKHVIDKFSLPWKQYLDLNGKQANYLSIREFPTNFLLDKSRKIIATNIEPGELEALLKKLN